MFKSNATCDQISEGPARLGNKSFQCCTICTAPRFSTSFQSYTLNVLEGRSAHYKLCGILLGLLYWLIFTAVISASVLHGGYFGNVYGHKLNYPLFTVMRVLFESQVRAPNSFCCVASISITASKNTRSIRLTTFAVILHCS